MYVMKLPLLAAKETQGSQGQDKVLVAGMACRRCWSGEHLSPSPNMPTV